MTNPHDPFAQQPENGDNNGYGAGDSYGAPDYSNQYNQAPQGQRPETYLVWSILATILCCLPFGAVAIWFSTRVDRHWHDGLFAEAADASRKAKLWSIIAAVSGIVFAILYLVLMFVVGTSIDPNEL